MTPRARLRAETHRRAAACPPRRRAHDARARPGTRSASIRTCSSTPPPPGRSPFAGTARVRRPIWTVAAAGSTRPMRGASSPGATSTSSGRPTADGFARWAGVSRRSAADHVRVARRVARAGPVAARRRVAARQRRAGHACRRDGSRAGAAAAERRCLLPPRRGGAGAARPRGGPASKALDVARLARRAARRRRDPRDLAARAAHGGDRRLERACRRRRATPSKRRRPPCLCPASRAGSSCNGARDREGDHMTASDHPTPDAWEGFERRRASVAGAEIDYLVAGDGAAGRPAARVPADARDVARHRARTRGDADRRRARPARLRRELRAAVGSRPRAGVVPRDGRRRRRPSSDSSATSGSRSSGTIAGHGSRTASRSTIPTRSSGRPCSTSSRP